MTEGRRPTGFRLPPGARWLLTAGVLFLLVWALDTDRLIEELSRFSLWALGLALLVSVAQVVLSAWRWRFTARCLGLPLTMRDAVRDYYLATFLNQCLPGGVMGDVNRAWRHGLSSGERVVALHGVMIERLSGQLVMLTVALCAGIWLFGAHPDSPALADRWRGGFWLAALLLAVGGGVALVFRRGLWRSARDYLAALRRDILRGLLSPQALPLQLGSSLLVIASYLAVFWLLAFSAYDGLTPGQSLTLLALCSLLLLAMVIPLTVAGWGVREGAAAILWPLAGLPAEQGVALSVGYGLTVLVSSLPGSLFVFSRPDGDD